jgi:sialic acid synthase SpsE
VNLRTMVDMEKRFGWPVGVSDHSQGIGVAVAATALGAEVIEKHLTLSRGDGGPDAAFSMEPHEFRQMVTECRRAAAALGEVRYGPTPSEMPQVQLRRPTGGKRAGA